MEDDHPDDWLPPGWRMEIRLRKFGRKDKHYYAPSGQKFFSKLEVLRHMKNNLPTDTPQLEMVKDGSVRSHQPKVNKEVSLHRCTVEACNNGDSRSPESAEKGKTSPDISTYFSCNSMDSVSLASGEENQVIEQNVEIHNVDTPNISCLLAEDGKTDIDEAAMIISGESPAYKLQNAENGILQPSIENHCAKNPEDSSFKESRTVGLKQSLLDETGRAEQNISPITSQKRNFRHQHHARTKVVVEQCVPEGLPEGWTKEIKVTKKNGNVRRDPYYTDPVSGYVFRSMKDVLRYLKTGDIGRLAFKPKDKCSSDVELEDEETPLREPESPLTKKQKLAERCPSTNNEGMEDLPEKVAAAPTSSHMLSGLEYAQYESKGHPLKLSEAVRPGHSEEKNDCPLKDIFSLPEAKGISEEPLQKKRLRGENEHRGAGPSGVIQAQRTPEEGKSKDSEPCPQNDTQIKDIPEERLPSVEESKNTTPTSNVEEKATRKPRRRKGINLPCRASSRLAGIAVDPTVEIPSRASRGNTKHIGREEPSTVKPEMQSVEVLGLGVDSSCPASDRDTPDGSTAVTGLATRVADNGNMENKMVEKGALPFELPSTDILQDPCIEFAIKTLTGMIDFNDLDHAFQPSNGMNLKSADPTGANLETEKQVNQEQVVGAVMAPKKPILLEEPAVKPITEETAADMRSSSSLGDSWSDPCIEFAIKTLTGAIPVEYGVGVQDIFRQEMCPSQIPESNERAPTGVSTDGFCGTDSLWQQQCATAEESMHMGKPGLIPSAPLHLGNVDPPRSGGSVGRRGNQSRR